MTRDFEKASTRDLLSGYAEIMDQLRDRGIIRTNNNPTSGYGEWLASHTLGLTLAPNSSTGHDATDPAGNRYEIKSLRHNHLGKAPQFSAVRKIEEGHFDFLVALIFRADFSVELARILTRTQFQELAFRHNHMNAHVLLNDRKFRDSTAIRDVTARFQESQRELP